MKKGVFLGTPLPKYTTIKVIRVGFGAGVEYQCVMSCFRQSGTRR